MDFSNTYADRTDDIIALFTSTFIASEGAKEGALIGQLVRTILATTAPDDMHVFSAIEDGAIIGTIIFTRLTFPKDSRRVVLLSPVAIATNQQGKGLGQNLLRHGLDAMHDAGVDVVLTYGDINFYAKTGFAQIGTEIAQPPQPLSYPEGWLGQSLTAAPLTPLAGPSHCVAAFDKPDYW